MKDRIQKIRKQLNWVDRYTEKHLMKVYSNIAAEMKSTHEEKDFLEIAEKKTEQFRRMYGRFRDDRLNELDKIVDEHTESEMEKHPIHPDVKKELAFTKETEFKLGVYRDVLKKYGEEICHRFKCSDNLQRIIAWHLEPVLDAMPHFDQLAEGYPDLAKRCEGKFQCYRMPGTGNIAELHKELKEHVDQYNDIGFFKYLWKTSKKDGLKHADKFVRKLWPTIIEGRNKANEHIDYLETKLKRFEAPARKAFIEKNSLDKIYAKANLKERIKTYL